MANRIQLRRDTAANWTRVNPVLEDGEPGLEIDTNQVKYGDGNTTWANLSYAGGSGSVSFDYSTVQEGTAGPGNVTSITGGNATGVGLTSEQWAQLMWVPNTANTTVADIGNGPATYNWAYVDSDGFRVESNVADVRNTWVFYANSLLTTPGNVQVGNVGSYGSISFVDTISANNYVYANGISILSGISGNTGSITFNGIKMIGANIGNGSAEIELVPDYTGDFYANGQYVRIYPTRAVPDSPHIHIDSGSGGDLILGNDQRGVDINHDANVYIRTDQYAGAYNWQFGANGNLTLPNGSSIDASEDGYGIGLTTDRGTVLFGNSPEFGQPNHFHIMKANTAAVDLFFGDDYDYVRLPGTGGIEIGSQGGSATWTFSNVGETTFPDHKAVTITGNLTVGNLTVTGNSTVINTESYIVSDNIIQMANANPADTLDLGFVAHRTVGGILQHTGLVRDAGTDAWRLFSNVTAQPGNTVDFTDVVYDSLQVGGLGASYVTLTGPINFTASPPAYSTPGIQWNSGWQGDIYGDSQVASYLSAYTGSIGNLRVTNTYTPVTAGGNVGDLHGQIRIDSDYLHVTAGAYGQQSYTVKAFASHVFASQYYIALAKGAYPKPQSGWEITRDGWGTYFALDAEPVDYGTYWWCSIAGYSGSYPAWSAGDNVVLRGTTSTVWKSVPLNSFKTPAYGNANVETYIGANIGAYQTWANATFSTSAGANYSNANVVANLQNFVTSISTTANITTTANVIAPNFLFANGVNILSTVAGGGSSYANADAAAYLAANSAIYLGNPVTRPLLQANVTQTFIGNATTIAQGGAGSLGSTFIMNNAYYNTAGVLTARNTSASGAGQFEIAGGTFNWNGASSATAGSAAGMGVRMTLSSSALATQNSIGITSAGTLTVNGASGLVTGQAVGALFNTTATTINLGGAATTINMGASTVVVSVGSGTGSLTIGSVNTTNIYTSNAVIAGGYISGTANIAITSAGNISGVGNIIGATSNTTITAGTYVTSFLSNGVMTTGNIIQTASYYETYSNVSNTGGNITFNFANSSVFYAALTANVTANIVGIANSLSTVTGFTVIIDQGATPYRIANIQFNGGTVTNIKWAGTTVPTGTASNTDIVSISLINLGNGNYRVLGQQSSYG